jgi:hypothetical protein
MEVVKPTKSNTYKTVHVKGFVGFWHAEQFELEMLSEDISFEGKNVKWEPSIECRLIFQPRQMKFLSQYLERRIKDYEKDHGEIQLEPGDIKTEEAFQHFYIG